MTTGGSAATRWLTAIALAAAGLPLAAQQSPHGPLELDCSQCHSTSDWRTVPRDAPFRHQDTGFPLTGVHAAAACAECHESPVFSRVGTACQDCHRDPHAGELGLACASCHDTRHWDARSGQREAHARTIFPLVAAHARLDCESCHRGGPRSQFKGTPTECIACHRADFAAADAPPHTGFSTDCRQCHGAAGDGWRGGGGFVHSPRFPLAGPHAGIACEDCHRGSYTAASTDCVSCHRDDFEAARDPDHVAGRFSTSCTVCHSGNAWSPASFEHAATGFPLEGAHRQLACEQCHQGGYAGTPATCVACHRDDFQAARDPNHVTAGFSTACQSCHTMTAWQPAQFDHQRSGFPLTGAHTRTECSACHRSGYRGTPRECVACHRADYDATGDPNHRSAGFSTACASCHTTTAWQPAQFDHQSSGFPLTGAHSRTECAACHRSGYTGTPRECVACHRADYDATRDPNHRTGGFPTACATCHTTTAWEPAQFDHQRTGFPLTGAHTTTPCASCHASGYDGTPRQCYACHRADYDATRDPNHRAAGFPTTCESCHTTRAWDGATFDHDAQYFPIYSGAHRGKWASCSTCHVAPTNFRVFECTVCHEHSRTRMDDKHREVGNYRYDSQACYSCHPDGGD